MKIKKILIVILYIAPCKLDAFFFDYFHHQISNFRAFYTRILYPRMNPMRNNKTRNSRPQVSLDELINQEIETNPILQNGAPHQSKFDFFDKSKFFNAYKKSKTQESYLDTLLTSTIKLQKNPKFVNKGNAEIIKYAKLKAGKAEFQTLGLLHGIWLALHNGSPIPRPAHVTTMTDEEYDEASKVVITNILFSRAQKSNKVSIDEKILDAQEQYRAEINMLMQQAQLQNPCKKELIDINDTNFTDRIADNHSIYNITADNSFINPDLYINPDESTGFTCIPNQAAQDKQKIKFDQSNPQFAKKIEAPLIQRNPSLHLHLIKKPNFLDFSAKKQAEIDFENGYTVTPLQAVLDKKINHAAFAGRAQVIGTTSNSRKDDIQYHRIIKFQQIPKEYRYKNGKPCEDGYRNKYGHIQEFD